MPKKEPTQKITKFFGAKHQSDTIELGYPSDESGADDTNSKDTPQSFDIKKVVNTGSQEVPLKPAYTPNFRMVKKETYSQQSARSICSQDDLKSQEREETTPMKQLVAGPCISLDEVLQSKKRMLNQLTGGEEQQEKVISKYFKRPEDPQEQNFVNLKALKSSPPKPLTMQSENWHVKRDDQKYQRPIEEKAKIALASLE